MAGQQVRPVGPGDGAGGVRADVGAALLLGHAHAGDQAALARGLGQPELVGGRGEPGLEAGGELRRPAQGRHDRVGHRRRAAVAHLDLGPPEVAHRPPDVGVRIAVGRGPPRDAGQAVLDRGAHQLVPGRVELHLVDPVAVAVVGAQPGRVLVRQPPPLLGLLAAGQPAEVCERVQRGPVGVPEAGLGEGGVPGDGVVPDQRRDLVGHLVGGAHTRTVRPVATRGASAEPAAG